MKVDTEGLEPHMTTTVQTYERKLPRGVDDALESVYRAAYADPSVPESALDAEHFATSTIPRHAQRPGFRLVVATTGDQPSGYAYGFTGEHGQFWSDFLAKAAPDDIVDAWVGDHFELVDIVVDPQQRGQGIAGLLHDTLVDGLAHDRALLATQPGDNAPARLYAGRGWEILVHDVDGDKALHGLDLAARRTNPRE